MNFLIFAAEQKQGYLQLKVQLKVFHVDRKWQIMEVWTYRPVYLIRILKVPLKFPR